MVDFGSGQGRSLFAAGGVAALRRGLQKDENTGLGRRMLFMDGHQLKGYHLHFGALIQPFCVQSDLNQAIGFDHGIDKT